MLSTKQRRGMWLASVLGMLFVAGSAAAQVPQAAAPASAGAALAAPGPTEPKPALATPAQAEAQAEPKPPVTRSLLRSMYDDGFVFASVDKRHELRVAASLQLDSRFYGGDSVAPSSFDIRRARLDFNANLFDRLLFIRWQAAMEDSPYIRNAYLDIRFHNAFYIRAGQMKVPFATQWITLDNQLDFLERGSSEPVYPFFDRGIMIWGNLFGDTLTYNVGFFTGAGIDLDYSRGDIDDHKDVAWRLFYQPFRNLEAKGLKRLYLVGQGTYGMQSVPTTRFETRGLYAANLESQIWRWRTEQTLGDNLRNRDIIAGEIHSRTRWGAELHYLYGPFTFSAEWALVRYEGINIYHDFYQGSKRLLPAGATGDRGAPVLSVNGNIHNLSFWTSFFLTGESKYLDNFGWKQPNPLRPVGLGKGGFGAFEILGRFSATYTDNQLFRSVKVAGYRSTDLSGLAGPAPGEGASVNAAVLDGAPTLYEATIGLNWTMNYHLRIQLDYTYIWAPDFDAAKSTGGIISAGSSNLSDPLKKNRMVHAEHELGFRFICRI
jgi:phosphate-selective porin